MEFSVTVPTNCTARVILPDGAEYIQGSGKKVYMA